MTNSSVGSPGAKSDEQRADGRARQGAEDEQEGENALADASPSAAADRRQTGAMSGDADESATEALDNESPGFTAEAETDAS